MKDEHLCSNCKYRIVRRGTTLHEEENLCERWRKHELPFRKITYCSGFKHANVRPMYEYEAIAWSLLTDKKGNQIGFHSPKDAERIQREGRGTAPVTPVIDGDD